MAPLGHEVGISLASNKLGASRTMLSPVRTHPRFRQLIDLTQDFLSHEKLFQLSLAAHAAS